MFLMQHNTNQMKTEKNLKLEYDLISKYCIIIFFIGEYKEESNGCVMTRMDPMRAIAPNLIHIVCFNTILHVIVSNEHDVMFVSNHVTFTFVY